MYNNVKYNLFRKSKPSMVKVEDGFVLIYHIGILRKKYKLNVEQTRKVLEIYHSDSKFSSYPIIKVTMWERILIKYLS